MQNVNHSQGHRGIKKGPVAEQEAISYFVS